jgi:hypothetical protein
VRTAWKNPLYAAQILTGLTAVGAIFADGQVTRLRLYLAAIAGLSMVTSLFVAARTEGESLRARRHLETLLRSMELPSFIIERLSEIVKTVANKHGWRWIRQENFRGETVYCFQEVGGPAEGRLVVSDDEFKRLWILEEDERMRNIHERLFGASKRDVQDEVAQDNKYLDEVIRQAVSEEVVGPHWVGINRQADGTCVFTLRQNQDDAGRRFLRIPSERRRDLLAMVPVKRYAAGADDAKLALRALLR